MNAATTSGHQVQTPAHPAIAPCADLCTLPQPPLDESTGKAFATLQARAALAGLRLGVLAETHGVSFYVLTQTGTSHGLANLAAVALFLRWAGVPQ